MILQRAKPLGPFVSGVLCLVLATTTCVRAEVVTNPGLKAAGLEASEVLLGELLCTNCHSGPKETISRLFPREAPRLERVGNRVTSSYLRKLLSDPQSVKPGSAMPAMLHAIPAGDRDATVDHLVHFLSSLRTDSAGNHAGDPARIEAGRQLYHQVGCVACHGANASLDDLKKSYLGHKDTKPADPHPPIPFGRIAEKTTVTELARFLRDPLAVRPSGRMPSLNLSRTEADSLAAYLLREQFEHAKQSAKEALVPGVIASYYEHTFSKIISQIDKVQPKSSSVVDRFTISKRKRNDNFGFKFRGLVRVPKAGKWRFWTASDDGSALYIDGKLVVDNDSVHGTTERGGTIDLSQGDHSIMVLFFEAGGGEELRVSWAGPGLGKQEIPPSALFHMAVPLRPLGEEKAFQVDASKAARGRAAFAKLGCAACHKLPGFQSGPRKPLIALNANSSSGCLSEKPAAGVPVFALSAGQRQSLKKAIAAANSRKTALTEREAVHRGLAAHNCLACHERDGKGGPPAERLGFFRSVVGDAMGVEGAIPPGLDRVGAKLRADWLGQVLTRKGIARPYMHTRMPQFGAANVGFLAKGLDAVDTDYEAVKVTLPEKAHRDGRALVGNTGLSCIQCHTFGKYKSLGIPALNLLEMSKRLKPSWFRQFLLDPQSQREGTRMPLFWPDGESIKPDVLGGNTEQQVAAIWDYLSQGLRARLPNGLRPLGQELIPYDEALIYRHWIERVGPRAIGVGYPELVHLAFDAAGVRPAILWQGEFLDAQRHRNGRGTGMIGPLGDSVVTMPAGNSFALLETATSPWPKKVGRDAGYRFGGYRLDKARRPTFLYRFGDVSIEDFFLDRSSPRAGFARSVKLTAKGKAPSGLYFLAARGDRIVEESPGKYLVDDVLTVHVSGGLVWEQGGKKELLLPVKFESGSASVEEVLEW
ncbi:MAG: c-type cytochrome [Planctomycetota bacterium]